MPMRFMYAVEDYVEKRKKKRNKEKEEKQKQKQDEKDENEKTKKKEKWRALPPPIFSVGCNLREESISDASSRFV
uniref:Uncharacterized protein n=1 Tax=Romanomermis culicivorax TaxID=13658 RepID=A0A915KXH6_ROMCU